MFGCPRIQETGTKHNPKKIFTTITVFSRRSFALQYSLKSTEGGLSLATLSLPARDSGKDFPLPRHP